MTQRSKRPTEGNRSGRVRRPFIGDTPDVLAVEGKDPNYVYRIVNDERGRVQRMMEAGYEVVQEEHQVSEAAQKVTGSSNTMVVDRRTGLTGVLMRIPKEWYDEDRAAHARRIAEQEQSIFQEEREADGRYGTLTNFRE